MSDKKEPTTTNHVEEGAAKNGNHTGPYTSGVE